MGVGLGVHLSAGRAAASPEPPLRLGAALGSDPSGLPRSHTRLTPPTHTHTLPLADPDDSATAPFPSPPPAENPPAAPALEASGRQVGIASSGMTGRCCPLATCRDAFFPAAANGSWLSVIPGATHATFSGGNTLERMGADALCGRGSDSRAEVVTLASTPLLAWLWQELAGDGSSSDGGAAAADAAAAAAAAANAPVPTPKVEKVACAEAGGSPMAEFWTWLVRQEVAGKILFTVKGATGDEWQQLLSFGAAPAPAPVPSPALEIARSATF